MAPGLKMMNAPANSEIYCSATDDGAIAMVRVVGKGTSANAPALRQFSEAIFARPGQHQFVLDLALCEMMDSTFLGTLAEMGLRQQKSGAGRLVALNCGEHVMRILKTMGLVHVLDVRADAVGHEQTLASNEANLRPAAQDEQSRLESICMVLRAHRNLADLAEDNVSRFRPVIEFLEESYAKEKARADREIGEQRG